MNHTDKLPRGRASRVSHIFDRIVEESSRDWRHPIVLVLFGTLSPIT